MAQLQPGVRLRCFGTPRPGQHGLEIVRPGYLVLGDDEDGALGDSLDPVHPVVLTGVGPAMLPGMASLPGLRESLLTLHRPATGEDLAAGTHSAQRRLALRALDGPDARRLLDSLPFALTGAQRRVLELQAQAAERTFEQLSRQLPGVRVGLVHGRTKASQKQGTIRAFKRGAIDLVVAATVIEVRIDMPNA